MLRLLKILTHKKQSFPKLNIVSYKTRAGFFLGGGVVYLFFKKQGRSYNIFKKNFLFIDFLESEVKGEERNISWVF